MGNQEIFEIESEDPFVIKLDDSSLMVTLLVMRIGRAKLELSWNSYGN